MAKERGAHRTPDEQHETPTRQGLASDRAAGIVRGNGGKLGGGKPLFARTDTDSTPSLKNRPTGKGSTAC